MNCGQGGDIRQQLVHTDPAYNGNAPSTEQQLSFSVGQNAGQAVRIADGDSGYDGRASGGIGHIVSELADACGTITNELLSCLGPRLERLAL